MPDREGSADPLSLEAGANRWLVSARPAGEVLVAEAAGEGLRIVLFTIMRGRSRRELQGRLEDLLEEAVAAAARDRGPRPLPGSLHHTLTGLRRWRAELVAAHPRSFVHAVVFHQSERDVAFGHLGGARPLVQVEGRSFEAPWIPVPGPEDEDTRGFSMYAGQKLRMHVQWATGGTHPHPRASVEAEWVGLGIDVRALERPALALLEPIVSEDPFEASTAEPDDEGPARLDHVISIAPAPDAEEPAFEFEPEGPGDEGSSAAPEAAEWDEGAASPPAPIQPSTLSEEVADATRANAFFQWLDSITATGGATARTPGPPKTHESKIPRLKVPVREAPAAEQYVLNDVELPSQEELQRMGLPDDFQLGEAEPELDEPVEPEDETYTEYEVETLDEPETGPMAELELETAAELDEQVAELEDEGVAELEIETVAELEIETVAELEDERVGEYEVATVAASAGPVADAPFEPPTVHELAPLAEPEVERSVAALQESDLGPIDSPAATQPSRRPRRPSWPVETPVETKTEWARRHWPWGVFVAVLFTAGWMLGGLGHDDGVKRPSPITRVLRAVGLGGSWYEVQVTSEPEGAWIAVDGKDAGMKTPATVELKPGEHEITISIPDHGHVTYTVRGERRERVPLAAVLLGSLAVRSPDTSIPIAVAVDGTTRGYAPLTLERLTPGPHEVRFSGPGMEAWGQTVDIEPNQTSEIVARPFESPATGVVVVRATFIDEEGQDVLRGAGVWIDGELRGVTPLTVELPRGPHSIRVAARGEEAPIQVIDLPGGNQRFADFEIGTGGSRPTLRLVGEPGAMSREQPTTISASLQGVVPRDVREMWLHVRTLERTWRRYPMTTLPEAGGIVGVAVFPAALLDASGRAPFYVSALTTVGDEYFTELQNSRTSRRAASATITPDPTPEPGPDEVTTP